MYIAMLLVPQNATDDLTNVIAWIVIGGVAGWLAGQVVKGRGLGVLGDIVVGIVGAVLGGWLIGALGFNTGGGLVPTLITAFLGAVILLVLIGLVRKQQ